MAGLPPLVGSVARRYRQALEATFSGRVRAVRVFGSMARGDANEDSDVDILVILERASFADRGRAIDLATELGLADGLAISPIVLTPEEWEDLVRRERALPEEVERDGVDV